MSSQLTVQVKSRGKPIRTLPSNLSVSSTDTTGILYQRLAAISRYSIHRLRITKGRDGGEFLPNSDEVFLGKAGIVDQDEIYVKDLGPQISWRVVYLVEYLGPLIIHPLIYSLRLTQPSTTQTLILIMIVLHFLKREYESVFVHRFSNATMPLWNIFKNCIHYWILSGILLAFFIYSTSAPAAQQIRPSLTYSGLAIWVLGEYGNLKTHSILRDLRAPGTNKRGVPSGLGFDLVTCPNYMFETIAWVGILLISRSWATVIFIIGSVGQMSIWARKKETRYRTEFKETYKRKKFGMIPGIC